MLRRLTHNFGWKLLSLAIAILFWGATAGGPDLATSVSAPVQYRNIPPDLEMASDVQERVHLEIRGPASRLSSTDLANIAVVLDLASVLRPGERTFTIEPWTLNLPPGVTLSRAVPAQLRFRFESRITREVPVRVRYSAPPPPGYRIVRQEVTPPAMRVIGPESRAHLVEAVQTDPLDLSGVVGESVFEIPAYIPDPQVRFAVSPMVKVRVTLERAP
ncbi:MAG: YbbR-like domain-containing protein [Acidobacteria bacterium]|nr:YbbR-like domain-containing protein [Acidobacteriota bacterium]